jgi:AcrR family transcriptional regulator
MTSTEQRILDGALEVLAANGLSRLALEDVGRAAGVSRQTVYRYFGSRERLIEAMILREEEAFIARVAAGAAAHADVRPAVEAAIATALREARAHPLLDRLLASEPEALLPLLVSSGGPLLSAARPVFAELVGDRLPHLGEDAVHRAADALTRLLVSYAVDPPDDDASTVAAELAGLLLDGIAKG